ncbi:MAG: hypothetical protein J6X43_09990 [Bacteroidales bacterium]|nr:hypothetical protein [Bacteroidales bacterium]
MKRNFSATVIAITLSFVNIALFVFLLVATDLFSQKDLWFQSSCVIIGTIVTAVITLLLLNGQSDKEEEKERNAKVFEEKLAIYKEFLGKLCDVVKDKEISDEESVELQFQVAQIAMHTKQGRIKKISYKVVDIINSVRNPSDDDNDRRSLMNNLFDIQEQFRQELYESKIDNQKNWNEIVKIFEELEQNNESNGSIPGISIGSQETPVRKFETEIEAIVKKHYQTSKFKDDNGFEILLSKSENGNSRNFIRFIRLNTNRGEYCVQVWLNLDDAEKRRNLYVNIKNEFHPAVYSTNHCATVYFDYTNGKYRFLDTFTNEINTLDSRTIQYFADRIIKITKFTENEIKK